MTFKPYDEPDDRGAIRMAASARAVLFDFDGTLTRPGLLDFAAIRKAMECPPDRTILEYISSLPPGGKRDRSIEILESFEMRSAQNAEPNEGAEDTIVLLGAIGVKMGILTRNSRKSVLRALKQFSRVKEDSFKVIIARDDTVMPKPDPEGVLLASANMRVPVQNILMVGDYIFDIEAGRRAGATTVFLNNGATDGCPGSADFVISGLCELKRAFAFCRNMRDRNDHEDNIRK